MFVLLPTRGLRDSHLLPPKSKKYLAFIYFYPKGIIFYHLCGANQPLSLSDFSLCSRQIMQVMFL